jgi:hypothetical protein
MGIWFAYSWRLSANNPHKSIVCIFISRIPAAASDKISASTFEQETKDDALSKITSFQYVLNMSNDEICYLLSIGNGSFAVVVSQSMKDMTLYQNTGRKVIANDPLQTGPNVHCPVVDVTSRQPFDRKNSPRSW